MTRRFFKDLFNEDKVWEVVRLSGDNYYVRQYIKGKQFGRGCRMRKQMINEVGMMAGIELL